ncbi:MULTISPECIES: NAD-dependent epimerase/dehydratase family protein [unclassified Mesorhizobium]|uniref:NAD-dependent epimerase/dehydratase family protein n=1 Tax=unclassified Mesorhizobium TaxID=325217 RepID=UPI000BAEB309|nr:MULTISPECIES: NAD-dependent epimerase/dehydratase family protein [unclassified Mesorhizobium]PBB25260.1 epimerase [Mesorhizobium sp. WSM4304]PBB74858.1 epimerase [Mesorhizobium sp. WSM4308]
MTHHNAGEGSHASAPGLRSPIFLTGSNGYLGRNLIRHFTGAGNEVIALVRSPQAASVVRALGAMPIRGTLDEQLLAEAMTGCSTMVHAAAHTSHGPEEPEHVAVNVEGTRAVFAAARKAKVRRAVHVSTESLLLNGRPLVNADENRPLPLTFPGAYSRTKAEAEHIALTAAGDGLDVMVVRPRFIWGRDDSTALPMLVQAAQSRQMAWIDGGRYLTSSTHIVNACHGIDLALSRGRSGEIYFLTDGEPRPFRELVSGILKTQGIIPPSKEVSSWVVRGVAYVGEGMSRLSGGRIKPPVTRQDLATMAVEVTLNISKARAELGYAPQISIEEGFEELRSMRT